MSQVNEASRSDEPRKPNGLSGRLVAHAVRRRPLTFAAVLLAATGAAASVWFFLPLPKVTATVVFHVAAHTPSYLPGSADAGVPFASYKLSQAALVKSRLVINAALKEPGVNGLTVVRSADPDPLTWLDRKIVVDSRSGSEFMRVSLEGEDGEELTVLMQAVAKAYLAGVDERDNGARKRKLAKLEETYRGYRAEVEKFQGQINLIALTLGSKDGATLAEIDAIHKKDLHDAAQRLSEAKSDYQLAESALTAWDAANAPKAGEQEQPVVIPEELIDRELRQLPEHVKLETVVTRARAELAQAEKDFDKGSPALTRFEEKLREAEASLAKFRADRRAAIETRLRDAHREALKVKRAELQNKVAVAGQRVQVLDDRVAKATREIAKRNEYRIQLEDCQRRSDENDQWSKQIGQEIERLKLDLGAPPRVTMSEEPYVMTGLEGNRRLKYTLMTGLGVFLLGFSGLVGWEYRSRRVTHTDEVTTALGVRLLGTVPPVLAGGPQAGLTRAALVEAIDTTRTMLLHGTPAGNGLRTVVVTSAGSGEGKTSLSGHLAISLARAGFNTLLVDGDLQSPSAHNLFDVPAAPGLSELLRGEIETAAAVRATGLPGLAVLPAGVVDLTARQCLIGARWRQIRQELESRFDFLVIDTAPLLLVSDTLLLAREADGVVLSVLLGVSQVGHVAETATRLRAVGANLTGAVVNGVWQEAYRVSSRYGAAAAQAGTATTAPLATAGTGEKEGT